jgi:hypothetical protein
MYENISGMRTSRRAFLAPALAPSPLAFRTLGRTGLKVTTVGFGCMITSDASVIERALDMGINYFDTARVYQRGNNERMVGATLKSRRKNVYLSSKSVARTKPELLADLETSLRELQTDYLDIWYLHAKSTAAEITDELLEAQRIAKKSGKIRFAGISNHKGHAEVIPAAAKTGHFDVLLTSYNFAMGTSADAQIAAAVKAGMGVVAMKVMAGGFQRQPFYPGEDRTRDILHRPSAMLAALKWTLRSDVISTTIPSMVDSDQLEENFRAMASPFTGEDGKILAAQLDRIRPLYCRMCGQCGGQCPQGIPIPDVLRYLAYAEGYGQFPLARQHYLELGECGSCENCGECGVRCPNGVRVRERVSRAREILA